MATTEELIKIEIQAKTDKADELKAKIAGVRQGVQDLADAFQKGSVDIGVYLAKSADLEREEATLGTQLGRTEAKVEELEAKLKRAGGAMGNSGMGRAVLEGSRAFEDLQYGISGVLNNIPSLLQALGVGAGLAGVVSLVAVTVAQLGPKLVKLFADPDAAKLTRDVEGLKRQIEELEKKDHKVSLDVTALDQAKVQLKELEEGIANFEKTRAGLDSVAETQGKAISEAIREGGGAAGLADSIAAAMKREGTLGDQLAGAEPGKGKGKYDFLSKRVIPMEQADLDKALAAGDTFAASKAEAHLKSARAELADLERDALKNIREKFIGGGLERGDERARAQAEGLFMRNRDLFGEGGDTIGSALVTNSRESIENRRKDERAQERRKHQEGLERDLENKLRAELTKQGEAAEREFRADEEKRRRDNALADALNRQGREGEAIADKNQGREDKLEGERRRRVGGAADKVREQFGPQIDRALLTMDAGGFATEDQFGRQRQVTPAQIEAELRREIGRALNDAGVAPADRGAAVNATIANAQQGLAERRTQLRARGLNLQDANVALAEQTVAAFAQQQAKIQQLEGRLRNAERTLRVTERSRLVPRPP